MQRLLLILSAVFILHSSFFIPNSHAQVAGYKLPDSGQTKCYQDVTPYAEIPCEGTGQDGAYNINPMSFTDNNNGTVTDNNTGLVWQKCSMGQNNDDTCSGTATTHNWYQATGTVCGDITLGEASDWRLPSKKELMSIVDYSIPYPGPTIQQTYFPGTVASGYWSSTTMAQGTTGSGYANYVGFHYGFAYAAFGDKNGTLYVRCVRGGQ